MIFFRKDCSVKFSKFLHLQNKKAKMVGLEVSQLHLLFKLFFVLKIDKSGKIYLLSKFHNKENNSISNILLEGMLVSLYWEGK